jgi:hypothetical protein
MTIGIIQPGRLGDVIICLPIAKYYADRGHEVVWPMFTSIAHMVREVVDYVTLLPVVEDVYRAVDQARDLLYDQNVDRVIDIAATFPGSECTDEYVRCGDGLGAETFDIFKYRLAEVPLEEKWKLSLKRDLRKEEALYQAYTGIKEYVVTSLSCSKGIAKVVLDVGSKNIIEMNTNHNIFHWITILERAKGIVCVESAVSNLVEQLQIPCKKVLIKKPDGRLPVLKGGWEII